MAACCSFLQHDRNLGKTKFICHLVESRCPPRWLARAREEAMFVIRREHDRPMNKVLAELTGKSYLAVVGKSLERHASARWQGSLREGTGTMTSQSGVLSETPY
jgi:hypothetical protein